VRVPFLGFLSTLLVAACGASLPSPAHGTTPRDAFVEVPSPPPPAQLERMPDRPRGDPVWVEGSWDWTGARWRWKDGGWFERPAAGVVYTDWQTLRPEGIRLLFAPAMWRNGSGAEVPAPRLLVSATMASPEGSP
jgi:hypothetical protein